MRYRLSNDVTLRLERFGSFAYIHSRNDFFALGPAISRFCEHAQGSYVSPPNELSEHEVEIACRVGILLEEGRESTQYAYSGVSLIGLEEVPDASGDDPLVVNCFCTAWCPLKCVYCHADDLMTSELRNAESTQTADRTVESALAMKPMVFVVTGGDPISTPERAVYMLDELGKTGIPIVLDTSGVGDIDILLPCIKKFNVHVRVSIDSFFEINDKLRPVNRKLFEGHFTSREMARITLQKLISNNVYVTAQTVLTKANASLSELVATRDGLIRLGVKHWVLHRTVVAGKARAVVEASQRKAQRDGRTLKGLPLVPGVGVSQAIKDLIRVTESKELPIDIRYTHANLNRNCVVLVGSEGDVYTEGNLKSGKLLLANALNASQGVFMWNMLNRASHIARYLNCQIPSN